MPTYSLAHKHKHHGEVSLVNKQHPTPSESEEQATPPPYDFDLDNERYSIKWYEAGCKIVFNDFIFHAHKC